MSVELTTLGEYARIQGGYAYKSKDFSEAGACPVLKIKNVRFGTIDYSDPSFISEIIANETADWKTKEGDILISMTGSGPNAPQSLVGRVARVWGGEPEAWINQRVGKIVIKDKGSVHPDFLFYVLSSPRSQDYLVSNSSGSANQANISGKIIESLPCPKLDFNESAEIAKILRELDQKIILNRQTNQTLEQIAQAMFKSWFVDFEPTRAKIAAKQTGQNPERAAMAAISGKSVDELDQLSPEQQEQLKTTAALFPDTLIDSELGEIPKRWEVKTFSDSGIDIEDGDRGKNYPKKTELLDSGFCPFLNNKNMTGDFLDLKDVDFISEEKDRLLRKGRVLIGDIILTTRGSIGNVGIFFEPYDFDHVRINSGMIIIKTQPALFNRFYLYQLLKMPSAKDQIEQLSSGSVQKQLPIRDFKQFSFLSPEIAIQDTFGCCIKNTLEMRLNESRKLTELRDALLPKLLAGELTPKSNTTAEPKAC